MMNEARFYFSLLLRRLPLILLIVLGCTAASIFVAFSLQPVYKAEATLVVESPQIPGELASSTVQASVVEILEVTQQRILTRANLLDLAQRFDIYADQPGVTPDAVVIDMRSRIEMQLPLHSFNRASFVTVSFAAPNGEMSAQVTNELVAQILQENVAMRTSVTGQTLDFFEQEVKRLDNELAEQGSKILEFQEAHKDALPDSLEYRRNRQSSLQERLLQLDRELSGLRDRRTRLVEVYERTGRSDLAGESLTPEQRRLRQLQDERASALVIYSPDHPQIRSLDGQIAALEAANIKLGLGTETAPNFTAFELQISDIDGQIDFIEEQKEIINSELEELAKSIEVTPTNAIALGTLERDYENLRFQYTQATSSLAEARTGDQIESQSRGQRITVTEVAAVPADPASPNRKLMIAAGFLGGVGLAAGLFLLLELLNNTVRRTVELERRLNITTFGTVPYLRTPRQVASHRALVTIAIVLPIFVVAAGVYVVQSQHTPGDLLFDDITDRLRLENALERLGLG